MLVCSLHGFLFIVWHTSDIADQTFFVLSTKCFFSAILGSLNESLFFFSVNYLGNALQETKRFSSDNFMNLNSTTKKGYLVQATRE